MFKEIAIIKFKRGMENELKEGRQIDFVRGEIADLRRKCLQSGATQEELVVIEDKIMKECYFPPPDVLREIRRWRIKSSNAMQM